MTQYNTLNVRLSNWQLNELKCRIKSGTEVIFKIWKMLLVTNDENKFLHKLLLTNTKVSRLHKAFGIGFSANIKLSKTQFHKKIGRSRGFLVIAFNGKCT